MLLLLVVHMLQSVWANELLDLQGAGDILLALKQATADDMLQPGNSAREDSTSPPQKQATVADVLPSWKIAAEESNEQPQQQPGNMINQYEDTITRGMALTALKQAQQVASDFASLREHMDLSGIVEADGQAMVARRPLPGFRCGTLITCFTAGCRHSSCRDRRSLYQPCLAHSSGTILCGCRCLSCDHALAQVGTRNHSEQPSRHIPKQQLGLDPQHQSRSQLVKGQPGPQLAPGGWSRQRLQ